MHTWTFTHYLFLKSCNSLCVNLVVLVNSGYNKQHHLCIQWVLHSNMQSHTRRKARTRAPACVRACVCMCVCVCVCVWKRGRETERERGGGGGGRVVRFVFFCQYIQNSTSSWLSSVFIVSIQYHHQYIHFSHLQCDGSHKDHPHFLFQRSASVVVMGTWNSLPRLIMIVIVTTKTILSPSTLLSQSPTLSQLFGLDKDHHCYVSSITRGTVGVHIHLHPKYYSLHYRSSASRQHADWGTKTTILFIIVITTTTNACFHRHRHRHGYRRKLRALSNSSWQSSWSSETRQCGGRKQQWQSMLPAPLPWFSHIFNVAVLPPPPSLPIFSHPAAW